MKREIGRITSFAPHTPVVVSSEELAPLTPSDVRVRVTHASLGASDQLARRGGYLFHPRPGFVAGYDFVGTLETSNAQAASLGFEPGARVTGILPSMGAHASLIAIDPSFLVAVPDTLSSADAAALPLDLVTARAAWSAAAVQAGGSIFVQGVTGAIGSLIAQHALAAGVAVAGTASARSQARAESLGVQSVDYHDAGWLARAAALAPDGYDALFLHLAGDEARALRASNGRIVRTAFAGRLGREKRDTLAGAIRCALRPSEQLCSVPLFVRKKPEAYRAMLTQQLHLVASGALTTHTALVIPFGEIDEAYATAASAPAGSKVVLALSE